MRRFVCWSVILLISLCHPARGQTLGTNFTYQGQVKQAGAPLNNTADFEFRLFNALSGGVQVGSTNLVNNVGVVDGLFTVSLNFGSGAFTGDQRWLEVAARSPAGGGTFTTLTPRQPLTAAPYAIYALTGPGSGGPWAVNGNNVFNTNTGNVGIGTTTPGLKLHVAAPVPVLALQDSNDTTFQSGYISFRNSANLETGYVGFGDETVPDMFILNSRPGGNLRLFTQTTERVTITATGNVGIGTTSPAAKLQVVGDVKLGSSAQLFAPGGEENLRIIRGTVDFNGAILAGQGYTVTHMGFGDYRINFNTPFAAAPSVTATVDDMVASLTNADLFSAGIFSPITDSVRIRVRETSEDDGFANGPFNYRFHFIAIGPR